MIYDKHSTYKTTTDLYNNLNRLALRLGKSRNFLINKALQNLITNPPEPEKKVTAIPPTTNDVRRKLARRKPGTPMKFSIDGTLADEVYEFKVRAGYNNNQLIQELWLSYRQFNDI